MNTLRRILTVSSLAVASCALSSALTLTVNCSTASGATEFSGTLGQITCTDWNQNFGTLTSINLLLTGNILSTSTVTGTNNTSTSQSGVINTNSNFQVDAASAALFADFGISNNVFDSVDTKFGMFNTSAFTNMNLGPNNNTLPALCSSSVCSQTSNVSGTGSTGNTSGTSVPGFNGGTFAPFEVFGAGSFKLIADTNTALVCGLSGGNETCGQSTNVSFTGTVVYTYNAPSSVLEPTTLFLMGSALVGCGLLRKRIKS